MTGQCNTFNAKLHGRQHNQMRKPHQCKGKAFITGRSAFINWETLLEQNIISVRQALSHISSQVQFGEEKKGKNNDGVQ